MSQKKGNAGPTGAAHSGKSNELCFHCDNACGGCSWSREFKPVPGWTAEPTQLRTDGGTGTCSSYHITFCPEFCGDAEPKERKKEDVNIALIEATMRELRLALRKSPYAMAKKINVSSKTLNLIESGNGNRLSYKTLMRVAYALGIGDDELEVQSDETV